VSGSVVTPGVVPLSAATDESLFGGKAVSLGAAIRAGLPVPPGAALAWHVVARVAEADDVHPGAVVDSPHVPDSRLAARSSAVGEDSGDASFAGQHTTKLNVHRHTLIDAVRAVWASAYAPSALAYREKKGILATPRIGVIVQTLVEPVAAGVLFTRNPITGADERLIESSWGLGEAVVNGTVVPDRYRLSAAGTVIEFTPGHKDIKIWYGDDDGTVELTVDDHLHAAPSLTGDHLAGLNELADRCRSVYGPDLDIEWAVGPDGRVSLLQCRPITTL
jgi:phosphoenolpyruvate synthase/pyruvate phosphate dikinase